MKKLLYIITVFTLIFFASCKDQENLVFDNQDGFVQLSVSNSATIPENSTGSITTSVIFGGSAAQNTSGITVNFEVLSSNSARYTVEPSNGILEIPAGETSAEITITPIDNSIADGSIELTLNILNTSSLPVGIGGEELVNVSRVITLVDDDCPIVLENMEGTYAGSDNWYSGAGGPLSTQIITSYDGTSFTMTGIGYAWLENPDYWAEEVITEGSVTVDIDTTTGEFEIPYTYTATTVYNGDPYNYYVKGSGKYFSCSDTFEIEYELFFSENDDVASGFGAPGFIWKETLTR